MTFEDMDDVSLATEHYMFSSQMDGACDLSDDEEDGFEMFHSQVDGEQDLGGKALISVAQVID